MDPAQLLGVLATWLPARRVERFGDGNGPTSQVAVPSQLSALAHNEAPSARDVLTLPRPSPD